MRLFKFLIRTYNFGPRFYNLYVLAENKDEATKIVYNHQDYKCDDDSSIVSCNEID